MIELYLIALMIVFITDIALFPHSVLEIFWRWVWGKKKDMPEGLTWSKVHPILKILECSTCQIWWITLIVTIYCGWWSVGMMAYCALLAFLAPIIKDIMIFIKDALIKVIDILYRVFDI